jgi:bacteriocin-like protein
MPSGIPPGANTKDRPPMATSKKKKLTTKDLKKVSGGAAKPGATGGPAKISQGRSAVSKSTSPFSNRNS